jgi:hypothetical protein
MNTIRYSFIVITSFWLGLLCSCATRDSIRPNLPAKTSFNRDAGRGGELFLTLRLENGEELLFLVDTGTPGVCLDKSLEPKLGKCYWIQWVHEFYGITRMKLFRAQNLYLGHTQLQTGNWFSTADLKTLSNAMARGTHNRPIMGILGMSCLKHYCIQLDFAASTMRFLDSDKLNTVDLGKAFPLSTIGGKASIRENLVGAKGPGSIIDTGCNFDGWLTPKLFQQWTDQPKSGVNGEARSPNGVLDGDSYPDIYLSKSGWGFNGIGLHFLGRHLVTFDFPTRTMYLKRTSVGPLVDEDSVAAVNFLRNLKLKGQLPGWSKNDQGRIYVETPLFSGTVDAIKDGGQYTYHFAVVRASKEADWELQRAWQTDASGQIKAEYPIHRN